MKWVIVVSFIIIAGLSFAQENAPQTDEGLEKGMVTEASLLKPLDKIDLDKSRQNILWYDTEVQKIQEKLNEKLSSGMRLQLEADLENLQIQRKQALFQLIEQLSGVEIPLDVTPTQSQKRNLLDEVQELLMPVIDSIRRASERPRKIEKLKGEIEDISKNLTARIDAKNKLLQQVSQLSLEIDEKELQHLLNLMDAEIAKLEVELAPRERLLRREVGDKISVLETARRLLSTFFRTKGINLFWALVSLLGVFFILIAIRSKLFKMKIFYGTLAVAKKPLWVLYNVLAFLLATLGSILCLYLLNDWLLVTLIIIILIGAIWSLKQFIPGFISEARLALNLGPVREGERIVYRGLPWRVMSIGFYGRLVNDELTGGMLRVSAKELLNYQSRRYYSDEPWFPTKAGDWVLLDDNTFGRVENQSPDVVSLRVIGGTIKFIGTIDFLEKNPRNLSYGFSVDKIFGLDYSIQTTLLDDLLPKMSSFFEDKLRQQKDLWENIRDFNCEFESAGAHSLNIFVRFDCNGTLASQYYALRRRLEVLFVEFCNEHSLAIPFEQLTIHQG